MMRSRLFLTGACLLLLTACGDGELQDSPVDGRDTDGLYEPASQDVSGRVIDGYLDKARIWLDLDGDYQYDGGSVDVTVGTNPERTITLAGGEPTTITGEGGAYTLDLSALQLDATEAADLDWRDYPLVVTVIPGVTEEETDDGNVVQQDAYLMSAPPGVRFVSPLTTLIDARRFLVAGDLDVTTDLGQRLSGINLTGDYIRAGDARAHAYARAMARFLAAQFPDDMESGLVSSDGKVAPFPTEALRIMRLSYNGYADDVVRAVDEAVGSGGLYDNVDVAAVDIPQVPLDLDNPVLLQSVTVSAPEQGGTASESALEDNGSIAAELTFHYSEDGVLQRIDADGCMTPSLTEITRLARVHGRVAELNAQGLDGFYLDYQTSRPYWQDDDVNERLVFDWENGRASFYSATTCHGTAPSSALGDTPQQVYTWAYNGQGVLQAVTSNGSGVTPVADGHAVDPAYSYTSSGLGGQAMTLGGDVVPCLDAISQDNMDAARVVSAQQNYHYTGDPTGMADGVVPANGDVTGLKLDWDVRDGRQQLLRRIFFDAAIDTGSLLQWAYDGVRDEAFIDADQNGLVRQARLARYQDSGAWTCGGLHSGLVSYELYGIVGYQYIRLSDYLADTL
ncbi:hypothetical protein EZI54_09630 [Marinobacter halodurans]|uniref:Lipoprotein n=1 Tax=Marinobacter halodurans TaxID=2528979 RepID=A0ABY1ZKP4_9GAMM|nr:hypothetical protein [Marinobacter halodurans]TBW56196.1 hypothetical protein EZI54_09630 [Marinobacter halodurans]